MDMLPLSPGAIESLNREAYLEAKRRTRAQLNADAQTLTFRAFIERVNPRFQFYRHTLILIEQLERVVAGEIDRLMVFEPPRHGKSELVSRLFPAYYLYRHPARWVGLNSYSASLAHTLSRNARENYRRIGKEVNPQASGVEQWETVEEGGMWAAGVGGSITGKGFHLGIIDDPLKNAEEAASEIIREKQKEWYSSTFYTRAEPGAAIVLIQTRWNEDDLSGWLLANEQEEPERWTIVSLPAIAESDPLQFPDTCDVIPDFRQPGEALCPERYSLERIQKIMQRVGAYFANALYQQRPTAIEGNIFKRHWWRFWHANNHPLPPVPVQMPAGNRHLCEVVPLPPALDEHIQSWDMAFKDKSTSSYVVGQVWARDGARLFLLDQDRGHYDINETIRAVVSMSSMWPLTYAKLIEDKANGPAVIQTLHSRISGLIAVQADTSKEARANAVSPTIESGNVYLPHPHIAPWVQDLIDELASFPNAPKDDQVDALTQAVFRLQQVGMGDAELAEAFGY